VISEIHKCVGGGSLPLPSAPWATQLNFVQKMGGREQNDREGKLMKNSEGVERDQFLREIDVTGL